MYTAVNNFNAPFVGIAGEFGMACTSSTLFIDPRLLKEVVPFRAAHPPPITQLLLGHDANMASV